MAARPPTRFIRLPPSWALTLLPWESAAARIFAQVVNTALRTPGVFQAELSVDGRLLSSGGTERPALIRVAGRGRPGPWIAEQLPAGKVRRGRSDGALAAAPFVPRPNAEGRHALWLRVGGQPVGELRLWHAGLPAMVRRQLAAGAERQLELEDLRRRRQSARAREAVLFEHSPEPALIVDGRRGWVLALNRRAAALARRSAKELALLIAGAGLDLRELFDLPQRPAPLTLLRGSSRGARLVWPLKQRRRPAVPVGVSAARAAGRRGEAGQWHLVLRDLSLEETARRDLLRAKETLAAVAVAGAQLQAETDRTAIFEFIGRELSRLGYHSALLFPDSPPAELDGRPSRLPDGESVELGVDAPRGADGQASAQPPPWRAAHVAAPPGHLLPRALVDGPIDPNQIPALQRALSEHRPIFSWTRSTGEPASSAAAAACRSAGTLWAPLLAQGAVFGALQVSGLTLGPEDTEGVAALALQVSMALERARLHRALKARSRDLEAEVERRTRELTQAVRALRELDRRKDNFVANVGHELRTPLVTILGYTQLLLSGRMGPLTEPQRQGLATANRNGQKLKQFIEELLDYSRHELTQEPLRRVVCPVGQVIAQAAAAIYPKLMERSLALQTRVAPRTPAVFADPERLVQVLSNLLSNAERHCHPGGRLWIAAAPSGAQKVRLSVSDDGSGIPAAARAQIFDRLYQAGDRAVARQRGAGMGLGLAIAKAIVESHGGRIWLDPRRRHGTRFCIELPAGSAAV